jgi:GR25 family glycosyltransferase involved in LPS biosynthesis
MEEIIDLETILNELNFPKLTYVAVFDPNTGEVTSVGPAYTFNNIENKVEIDQSTAELIIEGKIRLTSCFVDMQENKLEIAEIKSMFKIDDVLHRIVEAKWANINRPDVFIEYNRKKKILKIQLTEEFYGTKKVPKQFYPIAKRKVIWGGDTEMNFLITDYNDPNILYKMLSITISELVGKTKTIKDLELPERYSIYSRRVFKNYIIEEV